MSDASVATRSLAVQIADRLDQILLLGVYVLLFVRSMPEAFAPEHWYVTMLLISEGIVVLFVLARRSTTTITLEPWPWAVALLGTLTPLLVGAQGEPFMRQVGFTLLLIGTLMERGPLHRRVGSVRAPVRAQASFTDATSRTALKRRGQAQASQRNVRADAGRPQNGHCPVIPAADCFFATSCRGCGHDLHRLRSTDDRSRAQVPAG